jgi:hypothetical protein
VPGKGVCAYTVGRCRQRFLQSFEMGIHK